MAFTAYCKTCDTPMKKEPNAPPVFPRFRAEYVRQWSCKNAACAEHGKVVPEAWTD